MERRQEDADRRGTRLEIGSERQDAAHNTPMQFKVKTFKQINDLSLSVQPERTKKSKSFQEKLKEFAYVSSPLTYYVSRFKFKFQYFGSEFQLDSPRSQRKFAKRLTQEEHNFY